MNGWVIGGSRRYKSRMSSVIGIGGRFAPLDLLIPGDGCLPLITRRMASTYTYNAHTHTHTVQSDHLHIAIVIKAVSLTLEAEPQAAHLTAVNHRLHQ